MDMAAWSVSNGKWVGAYLGRTIVEFEQPSWAVERDQPGNFLGSVNQRKRELWPEILGSEANLEGSSRTPSALSQTQGKRIPSSMN